MEDLSVAECIARQSIYLRIWVYLLMGVNLASIIFVWKHVEARWVLGAMIVIFPIMNFLFSQFGFTRILGLAHVLVWTPLLVYLWRRRSGFDVKTPFGAWITAVFVIDGISLVIDYVDVIRYLVGDGALSC